MSVSKRKLLNDFWAIPVSTSHEQCASGCHHLSNILRSEQWRENDPVVLIFRPRTTHENGLKDLKSRRAEATWITRTFILLPYNVLRLIKYVWLCCINTKSCISKLMGFLTCQPSSYHLMVLPVLMSSLRRQGRQSLSSRTPTPYTYLFRTNRKSIE